MPSTWSTHGTKILGFVVALVGALGDCLELFKSFDTDPKHVAIYTFVTALGAAVIRRGFSNSTPGPTAVPMILMALILSTCVASSVLTGCTTLSFQEQLAAGYGTYTTVENAADAAFVAGTLPRAQALQARELAKQARPFLDAAKDASVSGDAAGANNDLQLATAALTALQKYVNAQVAKGAK